MSFTNPLQGSNVWPSSLDETTKHQLAVWFNESVRVSKMVASGLSKALGISLQALNELCDGGETISVMRLFQYFPVGDALCQSSADETVERIGSSPHTDWVTSMLCCMPDFILRTFHVNT